MAVKKKSDMVEICIGEYRGFRVRVPAEDIGRSDITLYIEHLEDNTNGIAEYNAWVAVGDADIRMLAQSGNVDIKKAPTLEQAIVDDLNKSNAFYKNLATICRVYEQFATVRN